MRVNDAEYAENQDWNRALADYIRSHRDEPVITEVQHDPAGSVSYVTAWSPVGEREVLREQ